MNDDQHFADGMAVRRNILGDDYVDRANANVRPYNKDFQDLLTRYGWGEIWTREGLSPYARRVLVIGTMIGLGKFDEFRMHCRPALLSKQLTLAEISEIILQQAIYCGLPAANTAFRELSVLLTQLEAEGHSIDGAR